MPASWPAAAWAVGRLPPSAGGLTAQVPGAARPGGAVPGGSRLRPPALGLMPPGLPGRMSTACRKVRLPDVPATAQDRNRNPAPRVVNSTQESPMAVKPVTTLQGQGPGWGPPPPVMWPGGLARCRPAAVVAPGGREAGMTWEAARPGGGRRRQPRRGPAHPVPGADSDRPGGRNSSATGTGCGARAASEPAISGLGSAPPPPRSECEGAPAPHRGGHCGQPPGAETAPANPYGSAIGPTGTPAGRR